MALQRLSRHTPLLFTVPHTEIQDSAAVNLMNEISFRTLGLGPKILQSVDEAGYTVPTPIQHTAIPHILERRDLIGIAQTGTGKTAAFVLPLLELITSRKLRGPKPVALILAPTRELAAQIDEAVRSLAKHLRVRCAAIFGGVNEKPQIDAMRRGVEIVVATPGRLLDLMQSRHVSLRNIQFLVLDEADRMLDMGFIVDVETILSRCPRNRQTALFSATMPYAILRICDRFMDKQAEHIIVRPEMRTVETVRQLVYFVAEQDKVAALTELTDQFGFDRLLVFRHTQIGVDRLTATLARKGRNVAALHGGLSQRERDHTLADFRSGKIQFLIATNVASRGLDITDLPFVLNYDIPEDADTYVHRVGRTARAGREGTAITLVGEWDLDAWEQIRKEVGVEVEEGQLKLYNRS